MSLLAALAALSADDPRTLRALGTALLGQRDAARDAGALSKVLALFNYDDAATAAASGAGVNGGRAARATNPEARASALHLLALLLDDPSSLNAATANAAVRHAVAAMHAYPDHREVLANGAAVIWVCAARHPGECRAAGAVAPLEAAQKKKHFANLEVGVRHPFRFKLGIVAAALARLAHVS